MKDLTWTFIYEPMAGVGGAVGKAVLKKSPGIVETLGLATAFHWIIQNPLTAIGCVGLAIAALAFIGGQK